MDAKTKKLVESHKPYGITSRHDLIDVYGNRIPRGTTYVNVGQAEGRIVKRYDTVEIVILDVSYDWQKEGHFVGELFKVEGRKLLKAVNEVAGYCQCKTTDEGCVEQRWESGRERPHPSIPMVSSQTADHERRHSDHVIGCTHCWDIKHGKPKCGIDKFKQAYTRSGAMSVILDDAPDDLFDCDPDSPCKCKDQAAS
jgi:hypothetical protein